MKWKTVIVLLSITLSIVASPSVNLMARHEAQIGTLDVCHSATPSLSSHVDMPWIKQWACLHLSLAAGQSDDLSSHLFKWPLIVFQDEHPPEV
jgi:hypothetical protein